MDSIFAQATATGRAGVSVIRLSGVQAFDIARIFCKLPQVGRTGLRAVRGRDGALIDQALVLCFEQGASFTGERVVEFQVHGGPGHCGQVAGGTVGTRGLPACRTG